MSELTFSEFIRRYNSLYKANNEIYHRLARHFGLSDTAFWILYTLREQGGCVSQSQLCGELFLSKQTIHSALKQLEQGGFLQLENVPNNRKNKLVRVTSQGAASLPSDRPGVCHGGAGFSAPLPSSASGSAGSG